VVGRLASFIAMRLRASIVPTTPRTSIAATTSSSSYAGQGEVHRPQAAVIKTYYWTSGYPGRRIKERTADKILGGKFPERILEKAVERMLPTESPLARKQMDAPAHLQRR